MNIRIGKNELDSKSASYIYAMSWKKAFKGIFSDKLLESIHNDFWIDIFNSNLKTKRFYTAIISLDGIDIGAGGFGYSRDYSDKEYGEITSIYILEEYWGKGYAKLLLRLSAILFDYDLPKEKSITKSKCPPKCVICVNAYPFDALTGKQWNINTHREDIINYNLCNQKRSFYIKTKGRKNSCGLCMVSCPIGL